MEANSPQIHKTAGQTQCEGSIFVICEEDMNPEVSADKWSFVMLSESTWYKMDVFVPLQVHAAHGSNQV